MSVPFQLSPITARDSESLADLIARSPDGGRVAVAPDYREPVWDAMQFRHPQSVGVIARTPGDPSAIGAAWVSRGRCRLGAAPVPYALIHSLVVDPAHRRRGVATAMTRSLLDAAGDGADDLVVMAGIQAGNAASLASARTWADGFNGRLVVHPTPMRRRPPRAAPAGVHVREVEAADLEALAGHLNAFHAGYGLWCEQDAGSLRTWLDDSLRGEPLNHYAVAVDRSGRLLAGVGIQDEPRLMSLRVQAMPRSIRLVNSVLHVVPSDHRMRNLAVRLPWFGPGQLGAGRHLWQTLRWTWRARGTSLVVVADDRGPVRRMIDNPPWLPTTTLTAALRTPSPLPPDRLLDIPVG